LEALKDWPCDNEDWRDPNTPSGAEHPKIAKDSDSGLPTSHDLLISRRA